MYRLTAGRGRTVVGAGSSAGADAWLGEGAAPSISTALSAGPGGAFASSYGADAWFGQGAAPSISTALSAGPGGAFASFYGADAWFGQGAAPSISISSAFWVWSRFSA